MLINKIVKKLVLFWKKKKNPKADCANLTLSAGPTKHIYYKRTRSDSSNKACFILFYLRF